MNENTRNLLILQMKRAIELLESENLSDYGFYNREVSELKGKLHEIRRDSIRFVNDLHK